MWHVCGLYANENDLLGQLAHLHTKLICGSSFAYKYPTTPGPDPEMSLPGGTGSQSLEPCGKNREGVGGEYERGVNPPLIRGAGGLPRKIL